MIWATAAPSGLVVLYDDGCGMCQGFASWLSQEPTFVPLEFVPCGSPQARARFPLLDHARTAEEITVVGDDGSIWTKDAAWIVAMWATRRHRPMAERLAQPAWRPMARAAAYAAAGIREAIGPSGGGGTIGACDEACRPAGPVPGTPAGPVGQG